MRQTITLPIILMLFEACQQPVAEDPGVADDTGHAAQELTAPVAGAVAKPAGFIIVPPWAPGVSHTITRSYGVSDHTGANGTGGTNDYYALDFNLALNEAVYPIAPGTVTFAGTATQGWARYGNIVFVNHVVAGVNYQSLYTHLSSLSVTTGATVSTETLLGRAGNTGTQDVHLHFVIYRGAHFQNATAGIGSFGGNAVVPEAFSSCTKAAGSCENLAAGNVLVKAAAPPPNCGAACTQCLLTMRADILPFYQRNGWDTSCGNRDAILANWCTIDPAGCASAKSSSSCQVSCIAPGNCGNACSACVLQQRPDILPFYRRNGWDTSCGNRNAIVANWCTIDSNGCAGVKTGAACHASCE